MTEEAIQTDVSPSKQDSQADEFQHPAAGEPGELSERDAMIERIADQNHAERMAPADAVMNGLVPEVDGVPVADLNLEDIPEAGGPADIQLEEGGSVKPLHEPEPDAVKEPLPDEYADDPLAEFIYMDGDKPMFRTVFDGKEKFIPLENAQRELQKQVAGDIQLEQNRVWQTQLEQREIAVRANELAYDQRVSAQSTSASQPSEQDVDDVDLEAQAREVVSGLFTGSEEEAAAKLAKLLTDSRGTSRGHPQIDPDEIAARAVAAAQAQVQNDATNRDVKTGYNKFVDSYPEIATDENLFRYADSLTDAIAVENPEWMPSEVMLEAGKRTREWVETFKTPEPSEKPNNDRQERKRNLRPMPRARSGTLEKEPEVKEPTAGDYITELRKQRGQAV